MKATRSHVMVLVTAPDRRTARRLAGAALDARACACAQLLGGVESHYVWQGRRERSAEILVVFKTTRAHLEDLERAVRSVHPYEVPQFVVVPIVGGGADYLAWVTGSTG